MTPVNRTGNWIFERGPGNLGVSGDDVFDTLVRGTSESNVLLRLTAQGNLSFKGKVLLLPALRTRKKVVGCLVNSDETAKSGFQGISLPCPFLKKGKTRINDTNQV